MRELVIRLCTTAITGLGIYLRTSGPIAGPRSVNILLALVAFWIMAMVPKDRFGNRAAGTLVHWTAVAGTAAIVAVLYFNPVQ